MKAKIYIDVNGNKTLKLTIADTTIKVQTNGNLPIIHSQIGIGYTVLEPNHLTEIENYYKRIQETEKVKKILALLEVSQNCDTQNKPIFFEKEPFAKNNLVVANRLYCDFIERTNFIQVYIK